MPSAPTGAIIIWNDIAPEGRAEFYAWHLNEHIPERLAVPGFVRGSRYVALAPDTRPEFLTLYETRSPAVATSAPYLARLNAPTPWTRRATAHFRNTARALTEVAASHGCGFGGILGTIRFDGTPDGIAARARAGAAGERLAAVAREPRLSRVRLCVTDLAASGATTAESRGRPDIQAAPSGAVLVEGCDEAAVQAAIATLCRDIALAPPSAAVGVYRLEHQLM
jgi:hypothetical protein